MKDLFNKNNQQKHQFKSYYCAGCRQRKPCGKLDHGYCCPCQFQIEQEKAQAYNSYPEVLVSKQIDREKRLRQLQLLKGYPSCRQCGSKGVDAYNLYENSRLVCQPCLMRKEGESSSPISFLERRKWFKRCWKIDLGEWLENYDCLPVNADCAREWLKDKGHLPNKCDCLEREAQETYELFANALREMEEKLKECQCVSSPKVRVSSDNFAWCERCEESIAVASKKRVIRNRNDPRFWGLEVEEKVLCGSCLGKLVEQMPLRKKYLFREYEKREYWKQ